MDATGEDSRSGVLWPNGAGTAFDHVLGGIFDAVLEPAGWNTACSKLNLLLDAKLLLMTFGADGRHDARFCDRSTSEPMLIHLARSQVESGKSIMAYLLHDTVLLSFHCKRQIMSPAHKTGLPPADTKGDLRYTKAMMSRIYDRDGQKALLIACREFNQPAFDAQEIRMIGQLAERLNIALECEARVRQAHQQAEQMKLMAGSHGSLSLLIDPMRRIASACGPDLEELGLNQILEIRNGRLNILARELEERFEPMIDKLAPGLLLSAGRAGRREAELHGPQELLLTSGSGTPCRIVMELAGQDGAPHLLMRFYLPRGLPAAISQALQSVYGLSKSEARLVHFLVASGSLNDTLESLSVTRNTAKTHLRRIYEKTGTRSQLELAQTVYRLASLYT
jgi:DNA-binding CsgD family transcriptional regulator